jgi:phosphoglycerate dehydrogenase-like enzyme
MTAPARTIPSQTKLVFCVKFRFSLWSVPESLPAAIRSRWPEMRVVLLEDAALLPPELPDTDIFVGFTLTPEQLAAAHKLKWIHVTAAGVTHLIRPDVKSSGIVLTNSRGIHAIPMTEHVIGMMVAMAHKFPDAFRYQAKHYWAQQEIWDGPPRPSELHGATLLLVGLGAIGSELARVAKAFGMRVLAVTRSGRGNAALAERIVPVTQLDGVLPEADYVVIAAPDTPATRHMIGVKQLAAMKRSAFLVNVARGTLVDEEAMIAALKDHRIAGAALDVTTEEPLPPESPLWTLENVFITPHTSSATEGLWLRQTELLTVNLERWFAGRELINRVDLEHGY